MALDPRAKFAIVADDRDYKRKLAAAKRDTQSFGSSLRTALRAGAIAGAAALTATTFAMVRLTSEANKNADALAKQADKLGIATEKLAALQLAGRLTGVQNEKLTMGMQRMTRRIAEAAKGTGEAQGALKELGLDAEEIAKLTLDEQFQRVAMAMQGVDQQSEKIRLGFKLFDSEGVDLIRTLDVMGKDFARIEDEARRFGVAISRVDAKQIEQANDAVERAQTAMQGLGTNIALAIAPLRESLATAFSDAALESEGFKSEVQATMEALVVGANFAANSIRGIQLAFQGTKLAFLRVQELSANDAPEDSLLGRARRLLGGAVAMQARALNEAGPSSDKVRAEIDATAQAMEALVGKFQSGEQALARLRELQADAARRAREAVTGGGTTVEGTTPEIFGEKEKEALAKRLQAVQEGLRSEVEAIRDSFIEREAIVQEAFERGLIGEEERNELRFELAQETADKVLEIERERIAKQQALEKKRIAEQEALERRHQDVMTGLRGRAVDTAIALLQQLGTRSKALAIAAIIAEKAVAVTRIIIQTNVAAARAMAELGPIAGPPAAFTITAWGYGLAAATAALGIAQVASVGSGSTGAPLGTPTNPVFTETSGGQVAPEREERVTHFHLHGDILTEDRIEEVIRRMTDSDRVIISRNSRQAAEIRRT